MDQRWSLAVSSTVVRTWPHWNDRPRADKDWKLLEGRPVAVERRVSVHGNPTPEVIPLSGWEIDVVPRCCVLVHRGHEERRSRHELHGRACCRSGCCFNYRRDQRRKQERNKRINHTKKMKITKKKSSKKKKNKKKKEEEERKKKERRKKNDREEE